MQQPDLNPPFFTGGGSGSRHVGIHGGAAEAASPISSRSAAQGTMFDDFGGEEAMIGAAGEEGDRGGSGNRWPRQETLLLLKLRSEMDSAFRDATLKGPLWEDVSRKLGELGYIRSAKKCKEKFENVHKYYKRTKEGRAGRQDGKTYRFFSQLEALHSPTAATAPTAFPSFPLLPPPPNSNLIPPQFTESPGITSLPPPPAPRSDPPPTEPIVLPLPSLPDLTPVTAGHVSFSSNSSSSSSSDSDTDNECRGVPTDGRRKRKRESWPGSGGKTMAFFEGIMKEMMERQELMQQRLLDTIEKREHDRMVREEAWKRQEMVRLNREYELMAHERAMAANRDAAVISFLQKFTGKLQNDPSIPTNAPEPPSGSSQPETNKIIPQCDDIIPHHPPQSGEPDADMPEVFIGGCLDVVSPAPPSSSRWPKAEVLALIKLRSGLETRYIDPGPKGPLWEEISLAMKKLGYNRSTKRCKEKWENINKYFKKVKEGNKKRPEDAKTCPYYHELDALYRRKHQHEIASAGIPDPPQQETNRIPDPGRGNFGNGGGGIQLQRSNGAGISQVFFGGALSNSNVLKKPEDIIKELMEQQRQGDDDEYDDEDEDDEEEEEEDGKLRYEVQFQRQNAGSGASGNPRGSAGENAPSTSNAGSFLAMVQ